MFLEYLPILLLFIFLFAGMPVAFALAISGAIGALQILGWSGAMGALSNIPYSTTASFTIVAIGMFILMAEIATQSGITTRLFRAANSLVGHYRGGLAVATMLASAAFGTLSGSSIAAAATMSRIAIPEMLKRGYSKEFAAGTVSIAGTVAILIPPSIPLIIFGIITETSIRKLLIAGMVPGIITVVIYMLTITIWTRADKNAAPVMEVAATLRERWDAIRYVWPFLLVILAIFAALYTGAVTTTEASAVGVMAVLIIWLLLHRIPSAGLEPFTLSGFGDSLSRALNSTVMILVLLIGAYIFSFYLILTGASNTVESYITGLDWPPHAILAVVILLYIVLGMFMSQLEIMILTLPFVFPIIVNLGFDPIWMGIIVVKTIEIGLVTPPVGMNVFVVSSASKEVTPAQGFKGITPFLIAEFAALLLLIIFPEIVTFVPNLMQ